MLSRKRTRSSAKAVVAAAEPSGAEEAPASTPAASKRAKKQQRTVSAPASPATASDTGAIDDSPPASGSASQEAPSLVRAASAASASASFSRSGKISKPPPAVARYASTLHWLMKNEPPYSLAALKDLSNQTEPWVGVRNPEARNMMQYGMKQGHAVLYYNASIPNPHVAGLARVASSEAYPDHTAWDRSSPYFDPHSDRSNPKWFMVDVRFQREFARPVYLAELRLHSGQGGALEGCSLFRRNRLSIHPLSKEHFDFICGLEHTPLPEGVKLKPEKKAGAGGVVDHPSRQRGKKKARKSAQQTAAAAKAASSQDSATNEQDEEQSDSEDASESEADEGESA